MPSFAEEQLRAILADLKIGAANFTLKLNTAKLDVAQSSSNKGAFMRFETRTTGLNRKIMNLEDSGKERQGRKWRLHPEVFDRDVLADLKHLRGVKAELHQLSRDLESFKIRAARHESISKMGMSSLELLNIARASSCMPSFLTLSTSQSPQGKSTRGTSNQKKKKSKVEKTVHVREHYRRPPQKKPESKASKKKLAEDAGTTYSYMELVWELEFGRHRVIAMRSLQAIEA
ncbi:hypothetical protein N431DRAFT_322819 [Stipitochalara longipes BDJ]|nr:hypothetical protein N431DRAFT_322819 [Stipitochalara longipes BDJ]